MSKVLKIHADKEVKQLGKQAGVVLPSTAQGRFFQALEIPKGWGFGLLSTRVIPEGTCLASFSDAQLVSTPTYQTVQVGEGLHIIEPITSRINHSCEPNLHLDVAQRRIIACKPIAQGELLTFFYPSTEWEMDEPFTCRCQRPQCLREIKGAKYLSSQERLRYKALLSPHIRRSLARRSS